MVDLKLLYNQTPLRIVCHRLWLQALLLSLESISFEHHSTTLFHSTSCRFLVIGHKGKDENIIPFTLDEKGKNSNKENKCQ